MNRGILASLLASVQHIKPARVVIDLAKQMPN